MTYRRRASTQVSGQALQTAPSAAAAWSRAALMARSALSTLLNGRTFSNRVSAVNSAPTPFARHQSDPLRSRFFVKYANISASIADTAKPGTPTTPVKPHPVGGNLRVPHGEFTIRKVVRNCVPIVAINLAGQVVTSGTGHSGSSSSPVGA